MTENNVDLTKNWQICVIFGSSKKNSIVRENSNSSSKNYLSEKNLIPRKSLKDDIFIL